MPMEAKLGLVLGVGLTIALAIFFKPAQTAATPGPVMTNAAPVLQGQTTSIRK